MIAPRVPIWFPAVLWLLLLALLPWWFGMPALLAMAAVLLVPSDRLAGYAKRLRRSLRWGLPGALFALQRGLGGDALAWSVALVGALAGFTLLAGLEAWLDRGRPHPAVAVPPGTPEWPGLTPMGPPAAIIELQPPHWLTGEQAVADPRGGTARWQADAWRGGRYRLTDGTEVAGTDAAPADSCCSFSPDGRWFAARLAQGRGIVLLDRDRGRLHRLRGWQLCGWHPAQPWLMRGERAAPMGLKEVLEQTGARLR